MKKIDKQILDINNEIKKEISDIIKKEIYEIDKKTKFILDQIKQFELLKKNDDLTIKKIISLKKEYLEMKKQKLKYMTN